MRESFQGKPQPHKPSAVIGKVNQGVRGWMEHEIMKYNQPISIDRIQRGQPLNRTEIIAALDKS